MDKIRFGTEGWRGIMAKDFTFNNVALVSEAICRYINKPGTKIIVGYDCRFLSSKFAEISADIFSRNKYQVFVSDSPIGSPNLSYATASNDAELGIMITASHNPAKFNGLKIKAKYGGPVPEWVGKEIEQEILKLQDSSFTLPGYSPTRTRRQACVRYSSHADPSPLKGEGKLVGFVKKDFKSEYINYLKLSIDFEQIFKKIKNVVVIDNFYGSTIGVINKLIPQKNLVTIRDNYDPLFNGLNPEPVVEQNLNLLKKTVLKNKALIGICVDGDGDRVGIVDDKGRYLSPHIVFPLMLYYLVEHKKLKGKVVQALSLGYLSERIAKEYSLDFQEVSIGFKNITELMLKEDVLLGGEESGGYAIRGEIPERDGFISGLILLEMVVNTGKKLSVLVNELQKKVW